MEHNLGLMLPAMPHKMLDRRYVGAGSRSLNCELYDLRMAGVEAADQLTDDMQEQERLRCLGYIAAGEEAKQHMIVANTAIINYALHPERYIHTNAMLRRGRVQALFRAHYFYRDLLEQSTGIDEDDLLQAGYESFIKLIHRFNPHRGNSLYLRLVAKRGFLREIGNNGRRIRLPIHEFNTLVRVRSEVDYEAYYPEMFTEEESARNHTYIKKMAEIGDYDLLFQDDTEGDEIAEFMPEWVAQVPAEAPMAEDGDLGEYLEQHDTIEQLKRIFNRAGLDDREMEIIQRRFGMLRDYNGEREMHTLEEVGEIFGLTRERIRQIEAAALYKLATVAGGPKRQPLNEEDWQSSAARQLKEREDERLHSVGYGGHQKRKRAEQKRRAELYEQSLARQRAAVRLALDLTSQDKMLDAAVVRAYSGLEPKSHVSAKDLAQEFKVSRKSVLRLRDTYITQLNAEVGRLAPHFSVLNDQE